MQSFTPPSQGEVTSFRAETGLDGTIRLSVRGELDAACSKALREELDEVVACRPPRLVVDLHAAGFLDSAALAALVSARRQLAAHGGELVLARVPASVRRTVQLTGLEAILPIES